MSTMCCHRIFVAKQDIARVHDLESCYDAACRVVSSSPSKSLQSGTIQVEAGQKNQLIACWSYPADNELSIFGIYVSDGGSFTGPQLQRGRRV